MSAHRQRDGRTCRVEGGCARPEPAAPRALPRAERAACCCSAREAGARVVDEPTSHEYGERSCMLEDLAGHRRELTQTVCYVEPEEWAGVSVADALACRGQLMPSGPCPRRPLVSRFAIGMIWTAAPRAVCLAW